MSKHIFTGTMPVDAGMIACIKKSYLEQFGPIKDSRNCIILALPKGRVRVTVLECWRGTQSATFEADAAEYVIGDPCYVANEATWEDFLKATNYGDNVPAEVGTSVSTGGDGAFLVSVSTDEGEAQ